MAILSPDRRREQIVSNIGASAKKVGVGCSFFSGLPSLPIGGTSASPRDSLRPPRHFFVWVPTPCALAAGGKICFQSAFMSTTVQRFIAAASNALSSLPT